MDSSALLAALAKITLVFAIGLAVDRVLRRDPATRRVVWTTCFLAAALAWVPTPKIDISILARPEAPDGFASRVYETEPRFQSLTTTYLPDPGPAPVVMLALGLACGGLAWLGWKMFATLRIVRAAEQITDEDLVALVYELGQRHGLSDAPILKASDFIRSPCVWGITQPVILVPTNALWNEEDWRLALEHELIHIRHRDPLRLILYAGVQHALWWNPFVWLGFRRAILSHEQHVDAKLADRAGYARLLTKGNAPTSQPVLARLLGQGNLLRRLQTLGDRGPRPPSRWRFAVLGVLVPFVPIQLVAPYRPDPQMIGKDEIVFVRKHGGRVVLYRMASDGRNPAPLPEGLWGVGVPKVSPDGRWLAYNRSPHGQEDIYIARVDGTGERLIVSTPERDVQPVWSPDGTRLVFCTMATGNWEIGLVDLQTMKWRFLTHDGLRNLEATWHPQGERIILSSHRSGAQKLWSMNLDGGDLVQLTFGEWEDTHGIYSANGRLVIFSSVRRAKYEATLLDLQLGTVQPLVPLSQLDTGEVAFTDSDSAVVMTSQDGRQPHIARVDLAGLQFRLLTNGLPSLWPATR